MPLVAELRERFTADTEVVEVEAFLSSQGYNRRQIGEILSLLFRDTLPSLPWDDMYDVREPSLRVQGPHERGRFAGDAWGYLIGLRRSGVLNFLELEHLVERALAQVEGRIGLTEIRAIAEHVGINDGTTGRARALIH